MNPTDIEQFRTIPDELLKDLNDAQREAVSTLDGPLVVVAGPGSGKTRVLTTRIAALIATNRARPAQILAVTFTNKAAGEMKERTVKLVGPEAERMWIMTFHSLCARLLRIESEHAQLPRGFSILDAGDTRTVLRDVIRGLGYRDDPKDVKAAASIISKAKNGANVRPDQHTLRIAQAYKDRLTRLGAVDFDDLLLKTLELLRHNNDVRARWQGRFNYLLIDEYQDTNPVQDEIVTILAAAHQNICIVGDADQSIYGFRSAAPERLTDFASRWTDTATVVLEENYRSSGRILSVCQSIIDGNPALVRPRLRTGNDDGEPVRLIVTEDDHDEARLVADEIAKHGGQTAILFRTNAQTRPFEHALSQVSVPYTVVGTLKFWERAEVKDALAWLKFSVNPSDMLSLSRVAAAPRRGIGPKTLETIETLADGGSLLDAMRVYRGRGEVAVNDLREAIERVVASVDDGPLAALRRILDGGLRQHVKDVGDNVKDRLENLDELINAAAAFEAGRGGAPDTDAGELREDDAYEDKVQGNEVQGNEVQGNEVQGDVQPGAAERRADADEVAEMTQEAIDEMVDAMVDEMVEADRIWGAANGDGFDDGNDYGQDDEYGDYDDLTKLFDQAVEGGSSRGRGLVAMFLENVALRGGDDDAEPSATMLLTAHAAKGKEFDIVYVVGVEENLFPHGRQGMVENEAEERRLLFVACSRARRKLTITRARERFHHGQLVNNPPSRFLEDLPGDVEVIEKRGGGTLGQGRTPAKGGSRVDRWGQPGRASRAASRPLDSASGRADRTSPSAKTPQRTGPRLTGPVIVGERVSHQTFGAGTIRSVSNDPDPTLEVSFDVGPARQLRLSLAPLERLP